MGDVQGLRLVSDFGQEDTGDDVGMSIGVSFSKSYRKNVRIISMISFTHLRYRFTLPRKNSKVRFFVRRERFFCASAASLDSTSMFTLHSDTLLENLVNMVVSIHFRINREQSQ